MIKYTLRLVLLITGVCISTGCASWLLLGKSKALDTDEPVVVGVPPSSLDRAPIAPYAGPHPAQQVRPNDPFDYPIQVGALGPLLPLFSGPHAYPFLCQTGESGLGQPEVDNHDGFGIPIFAEDETGKKDLKRIIGYSKDCQLKTQVQYLYNRVGTDRFFPLESANNDIATHSVNGETRDFILRVETGTINRFIYVIVAPAVLRVKGSNHIDPHWPPSNTAWNRKLIFQFAGGVGVGRQQGKSRLGTLLKRRFEQLRQGYAVVFSSAHQTSNNYHILRQEEVALRLKRQFTSVYGEPLYTVGVGGSGGAIQQYLLGQNRPGLLDAGIAQYAYPDMVTQTIYALDCDLLEYYFDISARKDLTWDKWHQRTWVQGLSAKNVSDHEYGWLYRWSKLMNGYFPKRPRGVSECVVGWRGPGQVAHNPRFTQRYRRYDRGVWEKTHWTHWEDLRDVYGVDAQGFAHALWDNVGVQYGLGALTAGKISMAQFLDLNARIGSWREQHRMQPAEYWRISDSEAKLRDLNIWSQHNMRLSPDAGVTPAPRRTANPAAIEAAFRAGLVFLGQLEMPIIDVRHYLDPEQDMHHSFASFSARARMLESQGHADNQLIWMAHPDYDPTDLAFEVMDEWMAAVRANPSVPVGTIKPASAQDQCFDARGEVIGRGSEVWNGPWQWGVQDKKTAHTEVSDEVGICLKAYPNFQSSRQVAGESVRGDTFKCALQSVEDAVSRGVYGTVDVSADLDRLKTIFPTGVCDYTRPGIGYLGPDIRMQRPLLQR